MRNVYRILDRKHKGIVLGKAKRRGRVNIKKYLDKNNISECRM
jgi:hypothetical protein